MDGFWDFYSPTTAVAVHSLLLRMQIRSDQSASYWAACFLVCLDLSPFGTIGQNKFFLPKIAFHHGVCHQP